MKKVLSIGEVLLRLSPPHYQTLQQTGMFDIQFGGSELNVLTVLRQLGHEVELLTGIPENELGHMAEQSLLSQRIGQSYLVRKPGRMGLYYYQKGYSLRPSRIIYDREYSVFSQLNRLDFNLDNVFDQVDWFHVSGITIALSSQVAELTLHLMRQAKSLHIPISLDLNYRENLWNSFQEAREVLADFVELADVCFGLEPIHLGSDSGEDFKDLLGFKRPYKDKKLLLQVLNEISQVYDLKSIAFTEREQTYNNAYCLRGYLYEEGQLYESPKKQIQVLDRVGSGDAFTAGILHGYLENRIPTEILEIGMASFVWKHTIEGDLSQFSSLELQAMLREDSFEIKR